MQRMLFRPRMCSSTVDIVPRSLYVVPVIFLSAIPIEQSSVLYNCLDVVLFCECFYIQFEYYITVYVDVVR